MAYHQITANSNDLSLFPIPQTHYYHNNGEQSEAPLSDLKVSPSCA